MVIKTRIQQLWGTQVHFANQVSITKQVLRKRILVSATATHIWPYWCKILLMEVSWLEKAPESMPHPGLLASTQALVKYRHSYRTYMKSRGPAKKSEVKP